LVYTFINRCSGNFIKKLASGELKHVSENSFIKEDDNERKFMDTLFE